ncbi:MAG: lipopolysaccharide assembly protein LapA domain-containing protein [Gammaproteobacteria bacterium]
MLFAIAWAFTFINLQPITIDFYVTSLTLPLAVALTVELFIGIALGMLFMMLEVVKLRKRNAKLEKLFSDKPTH